MGTTKQKKFLFSSYKYKNFTSKINWLKCIVKATTIGITESNPDYTVPDLEVNRPGYDFFRYDTNWNGDGVACYIRNGFF